MQRKETEESNDKKKLQVQTGETETAEETEILKANWSCLYSGVQSGADITDELNYGTENLQNIVWFQQRHYTCKR